MSNELLPNPDQYPDWKSWAGVLIAKMRLAKLDAEDLQNSLISADHIVAGSVITTKLAAGSITADKIAAGAITTSKLLVSGAGAALNSDPGTTDISAWYEYTGAALGVKYTIVDKGSAGKVGALALNGAGLSGSLAEATNFPLIPVDPNKTYRVRCWFRSDASANGTMYLSVNWYNQSGVITTNFPALAAYAANTAWLEQVSTFGYGTANPIPAGSFFMAVDVALNYGGTAGNTWAQDIRIEEVVPSTLIQDGSITTAKLVALSVTAAKIAAGTITANEIAANTITAAEIAADSITTSELAAGAVTAGNIDVGAVNAGNIIVDNIIITGHLVNNAVTAGVFVTDPTGLNIALLTESEVATGTFTTTNSAVLFGIAFDVSAGVSYYWRVFLDGSQVYQSPTGTFAEVRAALTVASGSAGSHTWSVKVTNLSASTSTDITNIEFAVKDWKK